MRQRRLLPRLSWLAAPEKSDDDVDAVSECSEPSNVNATKPNFQTTAEITPPFSSDVQRSGQNRHPATKLSAQDPSERTAIGKDLERHVVFAEPPEGTPGRGGCSTDGPVPSESDRLGTAEGQLWLEAPGPYVQPGMGGSAMDQLHGVEVRRVQSDESPPVDPICGAQGGSPRSSPSSDPSVASQRVSSLSCRDRQPFWTQIHPAEGQSLCRRIPSAHNCHGRRAARACGVRDVLIGDYSPGTHATESGSRFPGDDQKGVAHGYGPDQSHSPLGRSDREEDRLSDYEQPELIAIAQDCMTKSRDVQELQQLIRTRMLENELKEIANTHRSNW